MKETRYRCQASNGFKQMSFLPEPDFNLKLPSRGTHAYQALSLMLQGKKITSLDFQDETSSQRLPANIYDLVKLGWPIRSNDVLIIFEHKPHKRIFSQYFLDDEVINKTKGGAYE